MIYAGFSPVAQEQKYQDILPHLRQTLGQELMQLHRSGSQQNKKKEIISVQKQLFSERMYYLQETLETDTCKCKDRRGERQEG